MVAAQAGGDVPNHQTWIFPVVAKGECLHGSVDRGRKPAARVEIRLAPSRASDATDYGRLEPASGLLRIGADSCRTQHGSDSGGGGSQRDHRD